MRILTREQLNKKMRDSMLSEFGSQKEAAKHFGVSDQFISSVLSGKKSPSEKILNWLSIKRVVYFTELEKSCPPSN